MRGRGKVLGIAFLVFGGLGLVEGGCGYGKVKPLLPQEMLQSRWEPQEVPAAHVVRRDYRLREGDLIEIIYHVQHKRTESYKIKIQDVVEVRFPFNPSLNQVEQVQSDGTLHLDLVGTALVLGRTVGEMQRELVTRYSEFIKDPTLTVSFKESNVKIRELKEAIKTAPRGMSRLVPVTPGGTISLPFIADIRAAGLTIGELHRNLNKAYRDLALEELEVTVNLQTISPLQVFVFGEVRIPGALLNKTGAVSSDNQITLLQAIAKAGSYIPARADLSHVLLIRRRNMPRPQHAIINVYQLLENRERRSGKPIVANGWKHRYDVWLEDGDIIYVPTSEIAKRADYIEYVWTRGIRAVGGFSSSATYNLEDPVDWIGPNP
jgi:protein involved in polysaccharide export with SLBB domain